MGQAHQDDAIIGEEKKQSEIDPFSYNIMSDSLAEALLNDWKFSLNIKTAGKITRLASTNQEIEFQINEDGTMAQVSLKKGEEKNLGRDFILHFQHDKMFDEPTGFTQINEFGEQSFLVNFMPIVMPQKFKEQFF